MKLVSGRKQQGIKVEVMCSATPITVTVGSTHDSASSFCTADGVHKTSAKNVCYLFCLHSSLEVHGRTDMCQIGWSILMFRKLPQGFLQEVCSQHVHFIESQATCHPRVFIRLNFVASASLYLSISVRFCFWQEFVSLSLRHSLYLFVFVSLLARNRFNCVVSPSLSLALSVSWQEFVSLSLRHLSSPNPRIQFYHCKY